MSIAPERTSGRRARYKRRTTRSRATIPRASWSASVQTRRYSPRRRSVTFSV